MKFPRASAQALLFAALASLGFGQAIVSFEPTSNNYVSQAEAKTGITVGDLAFGSLTASISPNGANAHFSFDGFPTDTTFDVDTSLSFTISNTTGSDLSINGISFLYKVTNKGPSSAQFRYKIDSGSIQEFSGTGTLLPGDIDNTYPSDFKTYAGVGLSSVANNSTVTIYLTGYNASSSGGGNNTAAQLANLRVYTTNFGGGPAVPEPSAFAMLAGLGAMGFAATRRRRRS